jgi:hypothetical protein
MEYAFSQIAIRIGSPRGEFFPTFSRWAQSLHDHFIPHPRNNYHPHVLGHRVLGLFSLLLITVKVAAIALPLLTLSEIPIADASAINNDTVFSLTNVSRVEYSLKPLTMNAKLSRAAQAKADDMLAKQYFAHVSPDGSNPWSFFKKAGYNYIAAGENLAVDFSQAESVERAWMNSPGHRANILNNNFEEIGIGISQGTFEGHETTFVVQMFGTPAAPEVKTLTEPTIVAKPAPSKVPAPAAKAAPAPLAPSPAAPAAAPAQTPAAAASAPAPTSTLSLSLENSSITPTDGGIKIVTAPGQDAVKVIAVSGLRSYMLDPKPDNKWEIIIPQTGDALTGPVTLMAFDISGKSVEIRLASLSGDLNASYGTGSVQGASINFFGHTVDPAKFQYNFYLISIIALLTFMTVSIAVRYKVQHVAMLANSSFVAMLACLLWMAV